MHCAILPHGIDDRRCFIVREDPISRIQLGLNVSDLDAAVAFYSKLFGTEPAKIRPGYANFAITEPPLKLVLFANGGPGGSINHLGVEMETREEVATGLERVAAEGLDVTESGEVVCCYASQDKGWVRGPDGEPWELYTVLSDAEVMHPTASACCAPEAGTSEIGACCAPGTTTADEAACCTPESTASTAQPVTLGAAPGAGVAACC